MSIESSSDAFAALWTLAIADDLSRGLALFYPRGRRKRVEARLDFALPHGRQPETSLLF